MPCMERILPILKFQVSKFNNIEYNNGIKKLVKNAK